VPPLIVAGLGAIGGALGALVAIRNLRGTSTPYSVSTALAVLKGPSGALTAVTGMLLLAGGFVPGPGKAPQATQRGWWQTEWPSGQR
jgi:hypothetical protein